MVIWLNFFYRQLVASLVAATTILLLSEIFIPGSVLPYFNLHILVLVTLAVCLFLPAADHNTSRITKAIMSALIATLIIAYAWIILATNGSFARVLLAGVIVLVIGFATALSLRGAPSDEAILIVDPSDPFVIPANAGIQLSEETIEIEIVEEVDVFMN